jgi:hypothetical protein
MFDQIKICDSDVSRYSADISCGTVEWVLPDVN